MKSDIRTLCVSDVAFKRAVEKSMEVVAKEAGLKGFECVKATFLESAPFTVENNLLTPTFKLKRQQLKDRYTQVVTDMYSALGEK